tara:strand:- start:11167 stop:11625 length:459 start_codon:yes stop_codon:yes gene_type:complete
MIVVKHMTSINRSKTWITPEFAAEFAPEGRTAFFSEIQKDTWEKNKDEYLKYRKSIETSMNKFFDMQFKNSDLQKTVYENFTKTMKERLGHNEELVKMLVPEFEVGCRRITPVSSRYDSFVRTSMLTTPTSRDMAISKHSRRIMSMSDQTRL